MSIITLQFGQCGNQVGQSLSSLILEDILGDGNTNTNKYSTDEYINQSINRWFHINEKDQCESRSILIDAECKVARPSKTLFHQPEYIIARSYGGSANNWAFGYSVQGEKMLNEILDAVRAQVERSDYITSFMGILSSGGGTGSGVGCRVMEALHDEYPNKISVSVVVLPFKNGEIVTQNYNSLLTLAKLYRTTDATILFENDLLHQICAKKFSLSNIKFGDLNSIIAQQLAGILQPVQNISLASIVANVAAHPDYKFIQTRNAPLIVEDYLKFESKTVWKVLIKDLGKLIKPVDGCELKRDLRCIANVLISRGTVCPSENDLQYFKDCVIPVPWLPDQVTTKSYHQQRCFKKFEKFVSIISNNNTAHVVLAFILKDVRNILSSGAYLHHYRKYDVAEVDFLEAVERLEDICRNYFLI